MIRRDEYERPTALRAMQSLASRISPSASWRHSGDAAWAVTLLAEADHCPSAVWSEDGETRAWALFETPEELTVQVDPALPGLADAVLAWAEQTASAPELSVTISEVEIHVTDALRARGYTEAADGPFFAVLRHDLEALPPVPALPAGYRIRRVGEHDLAARADVHRAVWNSDKITPRRHRAMRATWPYKPEFDLMAVGPDGGAAAYVQAGTTSTAASACSSPSAPARSTGGSGSRGRWASRCCTPSPPPEPGSPRSTRAGTPPTRCRSSSTSPSVSVRIRGRIRT